MIHSVIGFTGQFQIDDSFIESGGPTVSKVDEPLPPRRTKPEEEKEEEEEEEEKVGVSLSDR